MNTKTIEQLAFILLLGVLLGWVLVESRTFPSKAGLYPWFVSVLGLVLVVAEIVLTLTRRPKARSADGGVDDGSLTHGARRAMPYLLWLGGLYAVIYLLGLVAGSALFVVAFLTLVGKVRWHLAVAAVVLLVGFLLGVSELLNLYWPDALVLEWLEPVLGRGR